MIVYITFKSHLVTYNCIAIQGAAGSKGPKGGIGNEGPSVSIRHKYKLFNYCFDPVQMIRSNLYILSKHLYFCTKS